MAKRRFQNPRPFREGAWWWIIPWQDVIKEGRLSRRRKRLKVCSVAMKEREAQKIAAEMLRPMNQGLQSIGSATAFGEYVSGTYLTTALPLLASTTQANYRGVLDKHIMPTFETMTLRDMDTLCLQRFFSGMGGSPLGADTILKMKEVLSSVLSSAVRYGLLTKNPMLEVQIPRTKIVNRRKPKPNITPEEFFLLIGSIAEPYATMIYVDVFSGLRPSELDGLKWEDVHAEALTVNKRYCRGDWSVTKTTGSSATIGVPQSVIARIYRLKTLSVVINWGGKGAKKCFKLVRSDKPEDLVFQSIRKGGPMNDQNILRRHLRPAALRLGLDPKKVTWRSLRTSYATWMVEAGANPKDLQGQMRHARPSTAMDIYAQHVPESQRRAVAKMMEMVESRTAIGTVN
jgi:integrase